MNLLRLCAADVKELEALTRSNGIPIVEFDLNNNNSNISSNSEASTSETHEESQLKPIEVREVL